MKRLLEYERKEGKNPLRIFSDKTAVENVAEGSDGMLLTQYPAHVQGFILYKLWMVLEPLSRCSKT